MKTVNTLKVGEEIIVIHYDTNKYNVKHIKYKITFKSDKSIAFGNSKTLYFTNYDFFGYTTDGTIFYPIDNHDIVNIIFEKGFNFGKKSIQRKIKDTLNL